MIVSKKISFDSAHFLPDYPGKCRELHGHRWEVELAVEGPVKEDGMVIDFGLLKDFLCSVKDTFDHKLINGILENPTAENIAVYLVSRFILWKWPEDIKLWYIRIWETPDSMVEVEVP